MSARGGVGRYTTAAARGAHTGTHVQADLAVRVRRTFSLVAGARRLGVSGVTTHQLRAGGYSLGVRFD